MRAVAPPLQERVLSLDQALESVYERCRKIRPLETAQLELSAAQGRVLAEPVLADRDFPPFPRATRDGYALRSADCVTVPATLKLAGQIKAGTSLGRALVPGEAAEIMTGAPVPAGADAVVMVEYTELRGDQVSILRGVKPGENVVAAGSEARAGRQMLAAGTRLGFAQLALAAAAGCSRLQVFRKPRVAILATGDELVELSAQPGPAQIRNSNSYSLAAQVRGWSAEPAQLPIAPDDESRLQALIEEGLKHDLLLLSGGVSMGKFDLVEKVLTGLHAAFFFTGALIQPGKPVVFGEVTGGKLFFGLPGNPVSTMVTAELFARPVLDALSGAPPARHTTARATLAREVRTKTGLTRFLPARLSGGLRDAQVELVAWQGSGDLMAVAQANCYLIVPPDREVLAAGEAVSVLLHSCPS